MSVRFIVAGTDTGVGKTVVAAMLMQGLEADYWKPVQAGLDEPSDTQTVQRLTGLPDDRFLPEAYRLRTPASPHLAAFLDGVEIDPRRLVPPLRERPLIIEAAGGLMVPMTCDHLQLDLFADWDAAVILCARTALGGINHALLSLEALRSRAIPVQGIIFVGDHKKDTESTICRIGKVARLGRLPHLDPITAEALASVFAEQFSASDFAQQAGRK